MKLLCVESHATQRRMIDLMLAATGIDVDFAGNGAEGLEAFQNTEYDAVLINANLGDMSGVQLVRDLRRMEAGFSLGYTPILLLGHATTEDDSDIGADGYLTKPFTSESLIAAIGQMLNLGAGGGLTETVRARR